MKYAHILSYVAQQVWCILPEKMDEILSVLAYRSAGHLFTAEEIQARIGPGESQQPESSKRGAVAVIPLRGVIAHRMGTMDESSGGMSAERFTGMMKAAVADPGIGTIVLDVDSPGGTVAGVPEAADAVFAARDTKRVIAVANATMASAAYWIASQAHEIVAIPSALDNSIGSIGAFLVHQDMSAHLEKEGIKVSLIKAGKHKAETNPFEPLSDEAKAHMQAMVDSAYGSFVKTVARGRGVSVADVRGGFGEGRAMPGLDAKAAGLIDRIDTLDGVIGGLIGQRSSAGLRADLSIEASVTGEPDELLEAVAADLNAREADRRRRLERF